MPCFTAVLEGCVLGCFFAPSPNHLGMKISGLSAYLVSPFPKTFHTYTPVLSNIAIQNGSLEDKISINIIYPVEIYCFRCFFRTMGPHVVGNRCEFAPSRHWGFPVFRFSRFHQAIWMRIPGAGVPTMRRRRFGVYHRPSLPIAGN